MQDDIDEERKHLRNVGVGVFAINKRSAVFYIAILATMVFLQVRFSTLVFVDDGMAGEEGEITRIPLIRSKIISDLPDEVILVKPSDTSKMGTTMNISMPTEGRNHLPVVGLNGGGELSCQALIDHQPSPDQWEIVDAISIKERTFNKFRNGKTHLVFFEGGLVTVLKLANSWGSGIKRGSGIKTEKKKKRKRKKDIDSPPSYGMIHSNGIPTTSKYNCSSTFWGEKIDKYGEHGTNLLNEMFAYHVDRVLGYNTVPDGKIVAIGTKLWSEHFATSVCAQPDEMKDYLEELKQQRGDLRLLGWLQYYVEMARHSTLRDKYKRKPNLNPKLLGMDFDQAYFACDNVEANTSEPVIYHRRYPESSFLKYYKYALVVKLSMRADVGSNCWWARHLKNPVSGCVDDANSIYAPVNVDNDRIYTRQGPQSLKNPCFVPEELRDQILNISNFTDSVLRSISDRDQEFLGEEDMEYVTEKLLSRSQTIFNILQRQFKGCQQAPKRA